MPYLNSRDRWGSVSITLHWLVVALIAAMAWLGLTMGDLPNGPRKVDIYALHKSIGLTILALVVLRLLWRAYAGAPAPVPGTPRPQKWAAALAHWALYALLLAMPLSGWLLNSAAGFPLQWFGLLKLPALAGRDPGLRALAGEIHEWLFWALAALATAHAVAAIYHHMILRDATLARMLPHGWLQVGTKESRDVA